MELGLLPQSPAVHNNGVKQVIDKWRKIFKHKLLSTQDITKLNSIGEGNSICGVLLSCPSLVI